MSPSTSSPSYFIDISTYGGSARSGAPTESAATTPAAGAAITPAVPAPAPAPAAAAVAATTACGTAQHPKTISFLKSQY